MASRPDSNMNDFLRLDLPWGEVREWHNHICQSCDNIIALCTDLLVPDLKPEEGMSDIPALRVLTMLLENKNACKFVGTPGSKPVKIPTGTDMSSKAELMRWGHRVFYHASAFRDGFRLREKVDSSADVKKYLGILEFMGDRFSSEFPVIPTTIVDLKQELWSSDSHMRFARFHSTYSDPVLYASLHYLKQHKNELEAASRPVEFLIGIVRDVLTQFMKSVGDVSASPAVDDDANLWWAHCELLRHEGGNYSVNGNSGYQAAAEVCRTLIEKCSHMKTLDPTQAIHETPPEVYGMLRTRLYVLKNCIDIASEIPADVDPDLSRLLTDFAQEQFQAVKTKELSNLYFMGVSLQVSSTAMSYYERFVAGTLGKKEAGIPVDAQCPDEVSSDGKPKSKAWSLGGGVFEVVFPDKSNVKFALDNNFGRLLEALVDCGGAATANQLTKLTKIESPGKDLGRGRRNPKYAALRPHVIMAVRKDSGGYKVTIEKKENPEKGTDEEGYAS